MPKEKVSYSPVGQGSVQKKGGEVTVQVGLILQDLDQLDEVLEKFIITACRKAKQYLFWKKSILNSPMTQKLQPGTALRMFVYPSFLRHLMVNERTAGSGKL